MLGVAYDTFAILLADDLQAALVIGRMAGRSGGFHGSSPILLLKNFNQDRGLALFQAIYGTNGGGFNLDFNGHVPAIPVAATEPVHRAANHALDIATYAVRQRGSANDVRALHHRTPYNITASRAYNAGKNELPHHVDALGNWVVLFSFGLTVDFYVGHKTVCVESGDALIFNGAAAHGVVHGFTHAVRSHSTYRGQTRTLVGMAPIDGVRLSVQARQS